MGTGLEKGFPDEVITSTRQSFPQDSERVRGRFLAGEKVAIQMPTLSAAKQLTTDVKKLGATAKVDWA